MWWSPRHYVNHTLSENINHKSIMLATQFDISHKTVGVNCDGVIDCCPKWILVIYCLCNNTHRWSHMYIHVHFSSVLPNTSAWIYSLFWSVLQCAFFGFQMYGTFVHNTPGKKNPKKNQINQHFSRISHTYIHVNAQYSYCFSFSKWHNNNK